MKRYGFTLIELLAVIAMIAVIATIAAISVTGLIDKGNEDSWYATQDNIKRAAESYALEFHYNLEYDDDPNYVDITLDQLVSSGYLKGAINNPITDTKIEPNTIGKSDIPLVRVTKNANGNFTTEFIGATLFDE